MLCFFLNLSIHLVVLLQYPSPRDSHEEDEVTGERLCSERRSL